MFPDCLRTNCPTEAAPCFCSLTFSAIGVNVPVQSMLKSPPCLVGERQLFFGCFKVFLVREQLTIFVITTFTDI